MAVIRVAKWCNMENGYWGLVVKRTGGLFSEEVYLKLNLIPKLFELENWFLSVETAALNMLQIIIWTEQEDWENKTLVDDPALACNKIQVLTVFFMSRVQFCYFSRQLHGLSVVILHISESTLRTSVTPWGYIYTRSPMSSLNKTLGAHVAIAH